MASAQPRQDLTPLLHARCVAIVGISHPDRFGGKIFRNLERSGFPGAIYGVNPRYDSLYGRPCYASLADLPERPDCALLAVSNDRLLAVLEETVACGIRAAVVFGSAFSDPDCEGPSLGESVAALCREHDLVLCGPNCMGFVSPAHRLPVSGYNVSADIPVGNLTLVSHSGSVWESFLQNKRGLAFNYIVSSGNESGTSMADYAQFALSDPSTRAIGLFCEAVRDPATFTAALEVAAERDIPVVVLKTGRSERGARLAMAHSGALAGEDAAYEAMFTHFGVRRATSIDEMMDTLELFATGMRPRSRYVSSLLDSGGQRALLVDLAEIEGVTFAPISDETQKRLVELIEPGLEPVNPLDAWGTGNAAQDIYAECLLALDRDPSTGLTLFAVDLFPLDDAADGSYPPVVEAVRDRLLNPLAFLGHASAVQSDRQCAELRAVGVPVLMGTETGLRAVRHVVEYAAFQRERGRAAESVREVAPPDNLAALRDQLACAVEPLDEHASKQVLAAYGLTPTRELRTDSLAETLRAAEEIGYPVVLKTAAGDLHKTERSGVRLDLADVDALAAAYRDFESRLGAQVLVQEMVPGGAELILGLVRDSQFGHMLTLGMGGIFVEIVKDVRSLWLPTHAEAVRDALKRLQGAALLMGVRGRPAADIEAVVRAALGLAAMAEDLGDLVSEVDVNPLVALPNRAVVVDALIVPNRATHRYTHRYTQRS